LLAGEARYQKGCAKVVLQVPFSNQEFPARPYIVPPFIYNSQTLAFVEKQQKWTKELPKCRVRTD
jgi:hypothetical protein